MTGKNSVAQVIIKSPFVGNARWVRNEVTLGKNQIHITADTTKSLLYCAEETMAHEFAHGVLYNKFFIDKVENLVNSDNYNFL
jgi:hypothetical protein